MDTALPKKFPFILDRNLTKANGTKNRVCTSCDIVVLAFSPKLWIMMQKEKQQPCYSYVYVPLQWLRYTNDEYDVTSTMSRVVKERQLVE